MKADVKRYVPDTFGKKDPKLEIYKDADVGIYDKKCLLHGKDGVEVASGQLYSMSTPPDGHTYTFFVRVDCVSSGVDTCGYVRRECWYVTVK